MVIINTPNNNSVYFMAFINTLFNLWPHGDDKIPGLRDGIAASADDVFRKYNIHSNLIIAHVMAQ
jgi:putative chitinase